MNYKMSHARNIIQTISSCHPRRKFSSHIIYKSKSNNPFFNIAFEQWLFLQPKSEEDNVLYLWRNGPSVIIGRFQSAWKECNVTVMENEKVNLVRRASGGGAVYQDLGNSIFSFLTPKHSATSIAENNKIITDALLSFGLTALPTGRNDIEVDGYKISGAAFRHSKSRSLHHGTLLLNVEMTALDKYLTPNKLKMQSKGVSSVAARVKNLQQIVPHIDHDILCDALEKSFLKHYQTECTKIEVDESFAESEPLVQQYMDALRDWQWRFGKEPEFTHSLSTRFTWGCIDVYIIAKNSIVESVVIYSDALDTEFINSLQGIFLKAEYSKSGFEKVLAGHASHITTTSGVLASPTNVANLKEFSEWIVSGI